ncbi:unnamed protein product, partial [Vitis vinifera]
MMDKLTHIPKCEENVSTSTVPFQALTLTLALALIDTGNACLILDSSDVRVRFNRPKMVPSWYEPMPRRVPRRVWLGFQKSMGILVGGNHTSSRNAISRPVSDEDLSMPLYAEGFDFVHWFKETVVAGDFVVLMMNAREVELKLLFELFKSGAICLVDEIFLHCSEGVDCNTATCKDCMTLFKGLRNSGVFVHQWWGF